MKWTEKNFNYQQEMGPSAGPILILTLSAWHLFNRLRFRFELKWVFTIGNRSNRYRRIVLQTGKGIVGHVFKTGKPFLVEDAEKMIGGNRPL